MSVCLAEEFGCLAYWAGSRIWWAADSLLTLTAATSDATTTLWYGNARNGNLRRGCRSETGVWVMTILGDPVGERIVLNEESMWNGIAF